MLGTGAHSVIGEKARVVRTMEGSLVDCPTSFRREPRLHGRVRWAIKNFWRALARALLLGVSRKLAACTFRLVKKNEREEE